MCPPCVSIILILLVIFNCIYRGFLDLVWLECLICGLEHEFVSFNKPYLCFFVLLVAEWCWGLWVCPVCFKRILFCLELQFLSIVWVFWLLFNKLIVKTLICFLIVCNKCKSLNSKMPLWQFVGRLLLVQPWIRSSFLFFF